jgi:hypothetical protein
MSIALYKAWKNIPIDIINNIVLYLPYLEFYEIIIVDEYTRKKWYNSQIKKIKENDGSISYKINDILHREDGPAEIYSNSIFWYKMDIDIEIMDLLR